MKSNLLNMTMPNSTASNTANQNIQSYFLRPLSGIKKIFFTG